MFIGDDYIPDQDYESEDEEEYYYYQDVIEAEKNRDLSWLYEDDDDPYANEEWRPAPGYEGLYEVSNMGRIKSLEREVIRKTNNNYIIPERILLQNINIQTGYPTVSLCKKGSCHAVNIHTLVARAFIDNPDNKECVNHIDTNRENNNVENLEWNTRKENQNNDLSLYKMSIAQKGKPSPLKGIPKSKEHIEKMRKTLTGRHLSEETKKKISENRKGYKRSDESIQKMLKTREEKGLCFDINKGKHKIFDEETGKYKYVY